MSTETSMNPSEAQQAEQARKQINQITEEIAQMAESDIPPAQFYSAFLERMYMAVQAFAAAIWIRTPQGNLVLQCQMQLKEVGLDRIPETRPMHDELLRQAALQAKGGIVRPRFSHNYGTGPESLAGNPTDYYILLVPVMHDKQVMGLLEIWQEPSRQPAALQQVYQFMLRMSAFISMFNRNHQLRLMLGQQELWLRLETFARQIHGSLHMTEVAYLIANEGRRLTEADRISVATRSGSKSAVTAISGADVVEKRSNLVQLMRALFDSVIDWGEKLVYSGVKDEALPPRVLHALDAYLAESNSKVLVVMPLADEREKERKKKARSALMMECFETNLQPEQLIARLDVVGRHACPALYNALEYRRIPMRFIWLPLAYLQDGLGGKAKAITSAVIVGLTILLLSLIFVPFPLKMEAAGESVPKDRIWLFSPIGGKIESIKPGLVSGSRVVKGQALAELFDMDLAKEWINLSSEIGSLENKIKSPVATGDDPTSRNGVDPISLQEWKLTLKTKIQQRENLRQRTNANPTKPGYFTILAPKTGIVLSSDFRENLLGKFVKPSDPLVRIGFTDPDNPRIADWEIQLKIPQKHYGQVAKAFAKLGPNAELDVDILVKSESTASYRGKLAKHKIASQANMQKDDNNEPEPVVLAWVRIHPKKNAQGEDDIPADRTITPSLLLSGNEITARIRCGDHAMGYSLFYGVWEFMYEKVVFPYLT